MVLNRLLDGISGMKDVFWCGEKGCELKLCSKCRVDVTNGIQMIKRNVWRCSYHAENQERQSGAGETSHRGLYASILFLF